MEKIAASNIFIIKLGGSIITDKSNPFSLRKDRIKALIEQIAQYYRSTQHENNSSKIIIVHGGGSFGHPMANQYLIHKGINHNIENQILGLSKTHFAMLQLNMEITKALEKESIPFLVFPPAICFQKDNEGMISFKNKESLIEALKKEIIPIFFGDIVFTSRNNFGILSGDDIIEYLAENLCWITKGTAKVSKVVYVFDQDGIFYETETNERKIFNEFSENSLILFKNINLNNSIDVTGSIEKKIETILRITRLGIPVELINGYESKRLMESLKGWCSTSTKFKVRSESSLEFSLSEIYQRKDEHIYLCLNPSAQSKQSSGLEHVKLIHQAIPKYSFTEIDTSTAFLNKKLDIPLFIGALTGGTDLAKKLNDRLSKAAQKHRIGMMLGSMRILLEYPEVLESFSIVRKNAPESPIVANIGISHIQSKTNREKISTFIAKMEPDAIALHFNILQELLQPEGDKKFANLENSIRKFADETTMPIIAKETGAGFSYEAANFLYIIGIRYFDVSGLGGTNFASIELMRSYESTLNEEDKQEFTRWGIPTAASIFELSAILKKKSEKNYIIASGGIRSGVDIVKAFTIGADYTAIAQPFIEYGLQSQEQIEKYILKIKNAIKYTMTLINSKNITQIKEVPYIIEDPLKNWIDMRIKRGCS